MTRKMTFMLGFGLSILILSPLYARPLDKVIAFYENKPCMSADFQQSVEVKSPHRVLRRKGRVYFSRPGRMRWDYKWPDEVYYVSDGTTFWAYDVDEEVVYKSEVSKSNLFFALKFLFNFKGIYADFRCSVLKSDLHGTVDVQLIPKRRLPVKKLEIVYEAKTGQVVQTVVIDNLNNRSTIRFTHPKYDNIPASVFDFKVPKGIPVRDLQKAVQKPASKTKAKTKDK